MSPTLNARLQKLRAELGPEAPDFARALLSECIERSENVLRGIKAYQSHAICRPEAEEPVLFRHGSLCLRDYGGSQAEAPILLVVPSLINRFHILDLQPDASFLRFIAEMGFRPIVIDWDVPGDAEKNFSLNDYVTKRLFPAVDFLQKLSPSGRRCHVLGYCMGGLLALALATLRPDDVRSLTLLATPWDFHQPDPARALSFSSLARSLQLPLQQLGEMPVDFIQYLFSTLHPLQSVVKFDAFGKLDQGSAAARRFVLLEDWLNDGVPLTLPVARDCFEDWYGQNLTARGLWKMAGTTIDPRGVLAPTYIVVPARDHIVPPASARALASLMPQADLHEPSVGHVGMMASRMAPQQVWAPLVAWLRHQEARPSRGASRP